SKAAQGGRIASSMKISSSKKRPRSCSNSSSFNVPIGDIIESTYNAKGSTSNNNKTSSLRKFALVPPFASNAAHGGKTWSNLGTSRSCKRAIPEDDEELEIIQQLLD